MIRLDAVRHRWRGLPLAIAFIALVWAIDVAAQARAVLIGFLALAPLLAAAVERARRTALVAALAALAALSSGLFGARFGSLDHLLRVAVVIAVGVVSIYVARARGLREERLRRVTEIARVTQQAVLREVPEQVGGVALAARYVSAYEAAQVGGDLYEVVDSPYGVRMIVGDVCGKGLEAVRLATTVMGAFRQSAFVRPDLLTVAEDLDLAVERDLGIAGRPGFVTAVLVEFGVGTDRDRMRIANCGHPAPLRRPAGGEVEALEPALTTPPLGLSRGARPALVEYDWRPGDRLLLYTDGLVEARDGTGNVLPIAAIQSRLAVPDRQQSLDDILDRLLGHVGGRPQDDIALLLAEHRPADPPG
ncbi:PP2C family protein-serine/threonine phosphatase [Solwaraspora sp. WMMD1047]|uniref:PP2C family protein-serine/threonine phosphatase n=1 Tax=Solwaraspora sp. WMMD1047 TaxID=3016102 RepID=UPI0024170E7C|nr:PP2C family protein-serine/threonine phosphatase [Solwaraspora sp. WMMD1047]MDG4828317.1 PP2C family protein-serine/threonine phosphatase [Solwaraspora sp. WMMD1047]